MQKEESLKRVGLNAEHRKSSDAACLVLKWQLTVKMHSSELSVSDILSGMFQLSQLQFRACHQSILRGVLAFRSSYLCWNCLVGFDGQARAHIVLNLEKVTCVCDCCLLQADCVMRPWESLRRLAGWLCRILV